MKLGAIASHLNLPDKALESASSSLGIAPDKEVSASDLERIKTFLESNYTVDSSKLESLNSLALPPTPVLAEPAPGGASMRPTASPENSSVGRLDLSGFGGLAGTIVSRLDRNDMILKRKTRNCGDTAGMVLDGLRRSSSTQTEQDIPRERVLKALSQPATQHEVWDITIHQHTFTLERHPDGSNMLIQSYQPGYNVQHWCGLDNPYLDNESLAELPKTWFRPSDTLVQDLGTRIDRLYEATREVRGDIWTELPFNPQDPLVDSERMGALAFAANRITFEEPQAPGATLRGLTMAIDELS